eukprot:10680681-Prorocentrum_lima.AAC.1
MCQDCCWRKTPLPRPGVPGSLDDSAVDLPGLAHTIRGTECRAVQVCISHKWMVWSPSSPHVLGRSDWQRLWLRKNQ